MEPMLREFAFPQSVHWPKPAARQQQPGIRIDSPGSRNKDKNDPASAHSRRRGVVRGLCGGCAGILQPKGGSMIWPQSHFGNIHISTCPYPHSPCFVGRACLAGMVDPQLWPRSPQRLLDVKNPLFLLVIRNI